MVLKSWLLIVTVLSWLNILCNGEETSETTTIGNTCRGKEDGEIIQVKLMADEGDTEYPIINVECNNDYMILNYATDNNIKEYFTSWERYYNAIYGPILGDQSNWEEWFLPTSIIENRDNFNLIISPDCKTCDAENEIQTSSTKTAYYMNSPFFRCFFLNFKYNECLFNSNTYECYICDTTSMAVSATPVTMANAPTEADWLQSGGCVTAVLSSDYYMAETRNECVGDETLEPGERPKTMFFKPSLGTEDKFCVCYKPEQEEEKTFEIDELLIASNIKKAKSIIETKNNKPKSSKPKSLQLTENDSNDDEEEEEEELEYDNTNTVYELYQKDFDKGPYRITKSGTYKIMENIVFDFNAPKDRKNGAFDVGSWWPTTDQSDEYDGAGSYTGSYCLGFFAGIVIETDYVTIDLNGFELKQSLEFYHIQRWFSIIELNNQLFEPGQGPGKWNGLFVISNHIEIKNGNMGLTSHFAIHGNYNKYVSIHDLNIYDFDTHGLQLNGFEHLTIENINVGPCSNKMYFLGEFGHAMVYLPRIRDVANRLEGVTMKFNNRDKEVTPAQLQAELERSLLYAWKYVLYNEKLDYSTASGYEINLYERAIKTFVNPSGISYNSVLEGIFLNKPRAKAFAYSYYSTEYSNDFVISNIKIFGLNHKMRESLGGDAQSLSSMNALTAYLDYSQAFKNFDRNNISTNGDGYEYDGSILQDVIYAVEEWDNDNWAMLSVQVTSVLDWVKGLKPLTELSFKTKCNSDVMAHSGKGILGLRLEGVKNGIVSNIEIYDLYDYGEFGMKCSHTEFASAPIQIGFSGNMVQGISVTTSHDVQFYNIKIHDLTSDYGHVYGFAAWTHNNITIAGNVQIDNINAGAKIQQYAPVFSFPNLASEACAYRVLSIWADEQDYLTNVTINEGAAVLTSNVAGHANCFGNSGIQTKIYQQAKSSTITANKKNYHNTYYNMTNFFILAIFIILLISLYYIKQSSSVRPYSYQLLNVKSSHYGAV